MRIGLKLNLVFLTLALLIAIIGYIYFNTSQNPGNYLVIISLLAAILAFAVGFSISHSISKSIKKLKNSADKISKGFLEGQIDVKGRDEIAELAQALEYMRYSLKMVIEEYEKKLKQAEKIEKSEEKPIPEKQISKKSKSKIAI